MPQVIVASKNPVKLQCTKQGFQKAFPSDLFEFEGVAVPSGVSDQPMTDAETFQGAYNRARNAREAQPTAHYWVGIEGGIESRKDEMNAFAWVVILTKTQMGKARTAAFQLPPRIVELINEGVELGHADDLVFKRQNSKQKNGAVGILTHDLIDRVAYYEPAVVLALVPFMNPLLY